MSDDPSFGLNLHDCHGTTHVSLLGLLALLTPIAEETGDEGLADVMHALAFVPLASLIGLLEAPAATSETVAAVRSQLIAMKLAYDARSN